MHSAFSIKGHITVEARDVKTGELVFREAKQNTIVNGVKTIVERLMQQSVGTYADYNKVWALYVGDDNTVPNVTQTSLVNEVFAKAYDRFDINVGGVSGLMELEMNLLSGEANGNTLREVAIYTRGDHDDPASATPGTPTMVARQVHGDLAKSAGITIKYIWGLQITT